MIGLALVLLAVTPSRDVDDRLGQGAWDGVVTELRGRQTSGTPAERLRAQALLARALVTSSAFHRHDARTDEATARALRAAESGGDGPALAEALLARGRWTYFQGFDGGRWDAARPFLDRARALFAGQQDARGEAEATFYLGLVEQQQGRLDAADARFRTGLALARRVDDPVLASYFHRHLAVSAEQRGQLDAAEQGYLESARLRLEAKACVFSPYAQLALAEFYETSHRTPEKAPALVAEAAATAARCGSNRAASEARLALAKAERSDDRRRAHAAEALSFACRFGDPSLVREVEAFRATLPREVAARPAPCAPRGRAAPARSGGGS